MKCESILMCDLLFSLVEDEITGVTSVTLVLGYEMSN